MADTFQIVFLKAGDGTDASAEAVAQVIATKANVPVDRLLASIRKAPFVYRKGLPRDKAEAVSRALNKLGAETLVLASGSAEVGLAAAFSYEGKGPQVVVLDPFPQRLTPLLHALCTKMLQDGWDLPGSNERKFVRGALGGRLVEWLAKAER